MRNLDRTIGLYVLAGAMLAYVVGCYNTQKENVQEPVEPAKLEQTVDNCNLEHNNHEVEGTTEKRYKRLLEEGEKRIEDLKRQKEAFKNQEGKLGTIDDNYDPYEELQKRKKRSVFGRLEDLGKFDFDFKF